MTEHSEPPNRAVWTRRLLVVSVALNLLIIGAVAGFALRGDKSPAGLEGLQSWIRAVPDSQRDAVRADLSRGRADYQKNRAELGELRERLVAALRDPDATDDAIDAILDEHLAKATRQNTAGYEILKTAIRRMSQEERREFVTNLRERRKDRDRDRPPRK